MNKRVVAELGRPETAEETAARKAESSAAYRSSQTARHLIAALIATLAIVVVIVFLVPRGTPATPEPPNVQERAAAAERSLERPVLAPTTPEGWRVNSVKLTQAPAAWKVIYAPNQENDAAGFLTLSQVFDGTDAWVAQNIPGATPSGTITIDGREWTEYSIREGAQSKNVTYAIGTKVGDDWVVLYGSATSDVTQQFASTMTAQLQSLQEG